MKKINWFIVFWLLLNVGTSFVQTRPSTDMICAAMGWGCALYYYIRLITESKEGRS
jgi:hypothetical protein